MRFLPPLDNSPGYKKKKAYERLSLQSIVEGEKTQFSVRHYIRLNKRLGQNHPSINKMTEFTWQLGKGVTVSEKEDLLHGKNLNWEENIFPDQ